MRPDFVHVGPERSRAERREESTGSRRGNDLNFDADSDLGDAEPEGEQTLDRGNNFDFNGD